MVIVVPIGLEVHIDVGLWGGRQAGREGGRELAMSVDRCTHLFVRNEGMWITLPSLPPSPPFFPPFMPYLNHIPLGPHGKHSKVTRLVKLANQRAEEGREGAPLPHQLASLQREGRAGLRAKDAAILQAPVTKGGGHEGAWGGREGGREEEVWAMVKGGVGKAEIREGKGTKGSARDERKEEREGGREGGNEEWRKEKPTYLHPAVQ